MTKKKMETMLGKVALDNLDSTEESSERKLRREAVSGGTDADCFKRI